MPLIKRTTFPPGGWLFYQPATNWPKDQSTLAGLTFDQVCEAIRAHRLANPRFNLSTDLSDIANELDTYTCTRLRFDPNYCTGGPDLKAKRPLPHLPASGPRTEGQRKAAGAEQGKIKKLSQGVGVLLDWIGSGGKVVEQPLANARANVCVRCPKNVPGGIESIFTAPAAERIRKHLALKNEMELKTPLDASLHTCAACLCITSLKVWVPIGHVLKKLTPEMAAALDPKCWILSEQASVNLPAQKQEPRTNENSDRNTTSHH